MRAIKQHILRINVKGKGYSVYAGSPFSGFDEKPAGLPSDNITHTFLNVEKRLDDVLQTGKLSWSVSLRYDDVTQNPVVAYGCFIKQPDEDNRIGLSFIHAVELNSSENLFPCVSSIIILLSNAGVRVISKAVEDIALGKKDVYDFLVEISRTVEDIISRIPEDRVYKNFEEIKIGNIEHDCAGAVATAWLMTSYTKINANPPWEIYDIIGRNGNIQTVNYPSVNNDSILASEIQRQSLKYFFDSISSDNLSASQEGVQEDISDSDSSESIKQIDDTNQVPKQKFFERWSGIAVISHLLLTIIFIGFGFYFINSYNNQYGHFLRDLYLFDEKLKQIALQTTQLSEGEIHSNLPSNTTANDEDQLKGLIGELFAPEKGIRATALSNLKKNWISDSRVIPLAIEYARNEETNKTGVFCTLLLIKEVNPDQIKQHKEVLIPFLDEVKTNGRNTQKEVDNIKRILNESV